MRFGLMPVLRFAICSGAVPAICDSLGQESSADYADFADLLGASELELSRERTVTVQNKIPSLRNVALTAPYFHNGDVLTLRDAVELYSRGGNVAPILTLDGILIEPLGIPVLSADEVTAIVAFLEALTDERVLYQRAPFDHPQLFVPNGHPGDSISTIDADGDGLADDLMVEIPAVGAAGGNPLPGFLQGVFGRTQ